MYEYVRTYCYTLIQQGSVISRGQFSSCFFTRQMTPRANVYAMAG